MRLPEFFDALDRHIDHVPIDALVELMQQLALTRADVEEHVAFSPDGYHRNLIRIGSGYAALILCWRPGQASPIHNHRGSACGVRVIDGVATEIRYGLDADGIPQPGERFVYPTGHVCGSYDEDTHLMCNEQPPSRDLVTLHVYTPPLREISMYTAGAATVEVWTDTLTQDAVRERAAQIAAS